MEKQKHNTRQYNDVNQIQETKKTDTKTKTNRRHDNKVLIFHGKGKKNG